MRVLSVILVAVVLSSCNQEDLEPTDFQHIPDWFPEMEIPSDNQLTQARIDLGRKLFYDTRLSRDNTISCGTCHRQDLGFADSNPIAIGVDNRVGLRNSPTIANIGYTDIMFADGGVITLELQTQSPIFEHTEFDYTIAEFLQRIDGDETYERMFDEAYGQEPAAFGISRGIAAFERTLISANSRFDQYEYQGLTNALSESEIRGRDLFFSTELECTSCHQPPLFTNFEFENIGLYENYTDTGRMRITQQEADRGKFKVPTLRNVELTAPFMHNGSIETLEEVVEHFNSGGVLHPNKSSKIKPLNLTEQEKADLVAFLKSLTDQQFISNPDFSDPN